MILAVTDGIKDDYKAEKQTFIPKDIYNQSFSRQIFFVVLKRHTVKYCFLNCSKQIL